MDSNMLVQLGLKIKDLRIGKDYTQDYVAEQIGCKLRTYQRYEAGEHLTVEALLKIGSLYDVSFFDIAGYTVNVSSDVDSLKAVMHLLRVSLDQTVELRAFVERREPREVMEEVNKKLKYGLKVGK